MSTRPAETAGSLSGNIPEFSVSEVTGAIKKTLEQEFQHIRVRGEVTELLVARSGHVYFSLKDENAKLRSVCWKGVAGRLNFKPEDGLEVIATGRISNYGPRSEYQLVVETMEPAGAGALMALLEERKKKLTAEGLFDADRKVPIPFLPRVIGVVTSPTGAVIRDILHRLNDRFPRHVLLWPVQVQGEGAKTQIAEAIKGFNALPADSAVPRPDVLIVARGGGSLEDLWAFNEEEVVRAAAESVIPLISAVGHETDTTLIDFASDLRAPTPTAAAELAVPVRADLVYTLSDLDRRQQAGVRRLMRDGEEKLRGLSRGLPSPQEMLGLRQQRFDELSERLPRALISGIQQHRQALADAGGGLRPLVLRQPLQDGGRALRDAGRRLKPQIDRRLDEACQRLSAASRLLDSLSYQGVLARGYAVVRAQGGQPVTASAGLAAGQGLELEFHDGRTQVEVLGSGGKTPKSWDTPSPKAEKAKPKKPATKKPATKKSQDKPKDQGSLF
ncbi:MAG: exodeoxyribonuclease VII large subunit [Alphaproteobacteria bacterium]|nr:exodeoxyribonuclease VII large subunit [Alphaproteobacteria bacterium]